MLIIPLDQEFLALQVFGSVELRQFYSLNFSHLWSCQTLQVEKISYFQIRCRYNSIPLWCTLSLILGVEWKKFRQEIPVWDSTVPSKQVLQKPLLDLSLLTFISIVLCRNCCLFSKAKCLLSCCRKKNVLLHITYWVFFYLSFSFSRWVFWFVIWRDFSYKSASYVLRTRFSAVHNVANFILK